METPAGGVSETQIRTEQNVSNAAASTMLVDNTGTYSQGQRVDSSRDERAYLVESSSAENGWDLQISTRGLAPSTEQGTQFPLRFRELDGKCQR